MVEFIQYGSKRIDFHLEYSDRKSLGITVTSELDVIVKSPEGISIEKIKERIFRKVPWILKQQSFFLAFHPKMPARKYISGETHLYMGRQYRLKIIEHSIETVKLKGQFIEVHASDKSRAKKLLKDWYAKNAVNKFTLIAKPLIEKFKKYRVEPSSFIIREMSKRWGSCTAQGKIILNPELIKAPKGCIEYVIIHELCHLVHHEHNQKFIDLQTKEMPQWEKWKQKLESMLA